MNILIQFLKELEFIPPLYTFPNTFFLFLFSTIINEETIMDTNPITMNMTYVYWYPPLYSVVAFFIAARSKGKTARPNLFILKKLPAF